MKSVTHNRRAFARYQIIHYYEAGLVLRGTEIKLLRNKAVSIEAAYALFDSRGELYLRNIIWGSLDYIKDWQKKRDYCKLLLHKIELKRIQATMEEKKLLLIPVKLYFKTNHAKVSLGLGKSLKKADRRAVVKKKEADRQIQQYLKKSSKLN